LKEREEVKSIMRERVQIQRKMAMIEKLKIERKG
jgi:hypothetical protein